MRAEHSHRGFGGLRCHRPFAFHVLFNGWSFDSDASRRHVPAFRAVARLASGHRPDTIARARPQSRRRAYGLEDDSRVHANAPGPRDRYRVDLAAAILDFLAFPTGHHELTV